MAKKKKKGLNLFLPLALFLTLCLLILSIALLREVKGVETPINQGQDEQNQVVPKTDDSPDIAEQTEQVANISARIAVIIDDIGWTVQTIETLAAIGEPITLALLPKAPLSKKIIDQYKYNENFEFLLHIPMEPQPPAQCFDKGVIKTDMTTEEIYEQLDRNFAPFLPYVVGANNHMGSKFTSNKEKMAVFLKYIEELELFFVDSVTSTKSYGYSLCKEMGIKTTKRDVFLDNINDYDYIKGQMEELVDLALVRGKAVGIGHPKSETIKVLRDMLPLMHTKGVEVVLVSELLDGDY